MAGAAPTIDVVIPTYNRADLLPKAIASVQAQTVTVARIIVADDGSTDGTAALLREAAKADPRIEPLFLTNGGANSARNAGIAKATAEWIAFLDSDDEWEPDKLAQQVRLLAGQPDLVAAFCGFRFVGGSVSRQHIPRGDPSLHDLRCANVLGGTSSAMIRTDVLKQCGGFDVSLPSCQDWDLWFRLRQAGRLGVVRQPLVRFNVGPHERITGDMNKVLRGHQTIFDKLLAGLSPVQRFRVRNGHRLVMADIRCRFGSYGRALALATRVMATSPSPAALRIAWRSLSRGVRQILPTSAKPAR